MQDTELTIPCYAKKFRAALLFTLIQYTGKTSFECWFFYQLIRFEQK